MNAHLKQDHAKDLVIVKLTRTVDYLDIDFVNFNLNQESCKLMSIFKLSN